MVTLPKVFQNDPQPGKPRMLPLLPLRDIVVFPHMVAPLFVGRDKSVNALAEAMNQDKSVFLATQKKPNIDNPTERDLNTIGTVGTVLQLLRLPDGTVKALVEGRSRAKILRFVTNEGFFKVEYEAVPDMGLSDFEGEALRRAIVQSFEEYAKLNKNISKELLQNVSTLANLSQLADTVAAQFAFKLEDKQKLLEAADLEQRLTLLLRFIRTEIDIFKMDQRIKGRIKEQMEKVQKNFYLNEQMRAIKKEMGAEEDP
ncbi:MAG: LON peptidase substrate-binding domain-containing protein, partial [Deltaproteobacteria bacterium]|nr:LON peptidase substrate-binding domain-containing protein [Deltaproteobacteria bacterium]